MTSEAGRPTIVTDPQTNHQSRIWLAGVPLDIVTAKEIADKFDEFISISKPHIVFTPNVDSIVKARRDLEFRAALENASLYLPDGMGVVYASRFMGYRLQEMIGGRRLIPKVCEWAESRGWRIYLFGSQDGIAESARRNLLARYPLANIVGAHSPSMRILEYSTKAKGVINFQGFNALSYIIAIPLELFLGQTAFKLTDLGLLRQFSIHTILQNAFILFPLFLVMVGLVVSFLFNRRKDKDFVNFNGIYLFVPIALTFILCLSFDARLDRPKYIIYVLPPFLLLLSFLLTQMQERWRRYLTAVVLFGLLLFSDYNYFFRKSSYGMQMNFKAVADIVQNRFENHDVLMYYQCPIGAVQHYINIHIPITYAVGDTPVYAIHTLSEHVNFAHLRNVRQDYGRIFLVDDNDGRLYIDPRRMVIPFLESVSDSTTVWKLNPKLKLYLFTENPN